MNTNYDLVPTTLVPYSNVKSFNISMDINGNPKVYVQFKQGWNRTLKGTAAYEFDRTRCRC